MVILAYYRPDQDPEEPIPELEQDDSLDLVGAGAGGSNSGGASRRR